MLYFRFGQAIGSLAANPPKTNSFLSGLLVSKDYSYTLLDPRDLRDFAGLSTCIVTQRQRLAVAVGWDLVRWHLEGMYGKVEEGLDHEGTPTMRVRAIFPALISTIIDLLAGNGSSRREANK